MPSIPAAGLRAPRQARSAASLERILDAIDDFLLSAKARNITVELRRSATSLNTHFKQEAAA